MNAVLERPRLTTLEEVLTVFADKIASAEFARICRKNIDGNEKVEYAVVISHNKQGGYTVHLKGVQVARKVDLGTFIRIL